MKAQMQIIAGLGLLLAGFSAGWWVNGMRMDVAAKTTENKTLTKDLTRTQDQVKQVSNKLGEVITKSQKAVDTTQATIDAMQRIRDRSNSTMEAITKDTQRLDNEITALGVPKCVFDFTNGSLWEQAGERANSGRRALYGTEAKPGN